MKTRLLTALPFTLLAVAGLAGQAAAQSIKVDTAKAFQGTDSVIVGAFTVGFYVSKTDSAKAGGGLLGSGSGGRSTAHSELAGIDDATMQAITDQAYADFLARAKAAGVTVQDRAALMADKDFAGTKTYPVPYEDSSATLMGPGNTLRYFAPSGFGGIKAFMGDIPGTSGGFAFDNPWRAAQKYADATKQRIVHVAYIVDFANAEKYGGWARSWSTVNVGAGIALPAQLTQLGIVDGYGGSFSTNLGTLKLDEPVGSNVDFATVSDSTSSGSAAAQGLANAFSLMGGMGSNSSRRYTFAARPEAFHQGAMEVIAKANDALLARMAALK